MRNHATVRSGFLLAALCLSPVAGWADQPLEQDDAPAERRAITIEHDIPFASVDGVQLLCDVYCPAESGEASAGAAAEDHDRPAVLVVHGGGWAAGDKWTVGAYGRALAESGIVAVAINYRHAPTHKFPAQVDDVRASLVWLADNAELYDIDLERIGMFGYSAGGHLVCMIGTLADATWDVVKTTTAWSQGDPRWERLPDVQCVVGGGAPCEFRSLPLDNTAVAYFLGGSRREAPEMYVAASPTSHASPGDVPTLFVHGTRDIIVPIASSEALYEAQRQAGVASQFVTVDGQGHVLTYLHPTTQQATLKFLVERLREE